MNLVKSGLAALLVTLAFAGSAAAVTSPANVSLNQDLGLLVGGSVTSFEHLELASGAFDDSFTFSVGANDGTFWDAFAARMRVGRGYTSSLNSLSSQLLQGSTVIATGTDELSGSFMATAGDTGSLAAANFTLRLWGDAKAGGSYLGTLSVTPVPEPGEWALMMSGLGLIGFMIRRRTSSDA